VRELHHLAATELVALFASRQLSPVELLAAVRERAEAVGTEVNAFAHTRWEDAERQARAAEQCYRRAPESVRPLEGIPVALKDEEPVEGWPCTNGSLVWADQVGDRTATVAQRIIDAGGIVHALTTTPELSAAATTISDLWGVTRNPWRLDYSPGGSSGGSAAALAAGMTVLATGSDLSGSIRIPASLTGVVGFKPPHGRVPVEPPFNLDTFAHNGPMARTVGDVVLLQNVIAGPVEGDATCLPRLVLPSTAGGIEGLRIAVSTDLGGWAVHEEVRANTMATANALAAAGAVVERVEVELSHAAVLRAAALHHARGLPFLGSFVAEPATATAMLRRRVNLIRAAAADPMPHEELLLAQQLRGAIDAVHSEYDVLIVPTACSIGYPAEEQFLGTAAVEIEGLSFDDPDETFMTVPFNILSSHPVLAVPSGLASNGIPTGVQIVARAHDDETAIRVGAAVERVRPWSFPALPLGA
jgi:Asp-tRNA(Asn)/Glu-tRNA(Gln) amidotransferase A subunit family amidase